MKCHKDLTQDCIERNCPMFFVPPNNVNSGECAETLLIKQQFWTSVVEALEKDKNSSLMKNSKTDQFTDPLPSTPEETSSDVSS